MWHNSRNEYVLFLYQFFSYTNYMKKKVLVSGVQSSGRLHIGNYFGAIKQNIELGNSGEYDPYVFIADYHSMTSLTDRDARLANTFDAACVYLACGLDPEKVVFFKQSDVPEHTELAWILNTVTPMPMLMLAHSLKSRILRYYFDGIKLIQSEAEIKGLENQEFYNINDIRSINGGLLTYPVLMAADILMYNADVVPVGKDQEQHLEITRELAGKYNRAYKVEQFTMPKSFTPEYVATVPGIDGRKMSKSYDNHIPLFASPEEIKKKVMSIVTDSARPEESKNPDENNIYQIHKLFLSREEDKVLRAKFESGGYGYKEAKDNLLAAILDFTAPMREKYEYYQTHRDEVEDILQKGAEKAREKARETMRKVREQTGLGQ
jgi:tryptophanyl-tRNA synthetase